MTPATSRRVRVVVNGKPYVVEVGDLAASPVTVHVNGRPYLVTIDPADSDHATATAPGPAVGEKPTRETPHPTTQPANQPTATVKAPMPGNILDIAVRPGDHVRFRQQLCSLEAMKMKTAIRSPRDGTIAGVEVVEGQSVAHDDVLFTFE